MITHLREGFRRGIVIGGVSSLHMRGVPAGRGNEKKEPLAPKRSRRYLRIMIMHRREGVCSGIPIGGVSSLHVREVPAARENDKKRCLFKKA